MIQLCLEDDYITIFFDQHLLVFSPIFFLEIILTLALEQ